MSFIDKPKQIEEPRTETPDKEVEAVVQELIKKNELVCILNVLSAQDIIPLFFKGTALAYSLYPEPHQRARFDHDVLVAEKD